MSTEIGARLRYWRELLFGWWAVVAAIIAVVGVVDTIQAHLPVAPGTTPSPTWHLPLLPPSWWLFLVTLSLLIGVLEKAYRLHYKQREIATARGAQDLGKQLGTLSMEILSFFEDRADLDSERPALPADTDAHTRWQRDVSARQQTTAKFNTKFAGRVHASLVQLESLGFDIPFQVRAALGYDSTVGKYLAAVGELIAAGELEQAKRISKESAFYMHG